MKISIQSENWPWPVEKYRYPMEQMLITLFPGEKLEFLDASLSSHLPDQGDLCVEFRVLEDSPSGRIKGQAGIGITYNLGPDREEMPPHGDIQEWTDQSCGGPHSFFKPFSPKKRKILYESEEAAYHLVSHAVKRLIYGAGKKMLVFSGQKKEGFELPWGCLTGVRPVKLPTRAMMDGKTPEEAEEELRRNYFVSGDRAALAVECAQAALAVNHRLDPQGLSLYIGIPFCPTRCAYCSFISAGMKRSLELVEPYVEALCREIQLAGSLLREKGLHISCAYMGGGTPTTLSEEQLDRVLSELERCLPMERCGEFTVEAGRPDTITAGKLETLRAHGIHRISINPQTMEDQVLQAMGRAHTAGQIEEAMGLAERHFSGMVNMDLIAGLPEDSLEGFSRTLNKVRDMDPANITVHTLALKKGSRLTEEGGNLCAPETVEAMLALASRRLREAGYRPYYLYRQKYMSGSFENVGWAKPGSLCAYNIVMMEELQTVLSLGAGGITKLVDPKQRKIVRLNNPKYAKEYLESWEKIAAAKHSAAQFQAELAERNKSIKKSGLV